VVATIASKTRADRYIPLIAAAGRPTRPSAPARPREAGSVLHRYAADRDRRPPTRRVACAELRALETTMVHSRCGDAVGRRPPDEQYAALAPARINDLALTARRRTRPARRGHELAITAHRPISDLTHAGTAWIPADSQRPCPAPCCPDRLCSATVVPPRCSRNGEAGIRRAAAPSGGLPDDTVENASALFR